LKARHQGVGEQSNQQGGGVKEEVTREPLTENESRHVEWSVGKGLELEFVSAMFVGS
jgi:hypothetical protein